MSNTKAVSILCGAVLFLAVCTALIVLNREDKGFITARCAAGQGVERPISWPASELPIRVYVTPDAEQFFPVVAKAAYAWGSRTGLDLFSVPRKLEPFKRNSCLDLADPFGPLVMVHTMNGDGVGESSHAQIHWDSSCRIRCVDVYIPLSLDRGYLEHVALHEMGHALGLSHVPDEKAYMYPTLKFMGDNITGAAMRDLKRAYSPRAMMEELQ